MVKRVGFQLTTPALLVDTLSHYPHVTAEVDMSMWIFRESIGRLLLVLRAHSDVKLHSQSSRLLHLDEGKRRRFVSGVDAEIGP